MLLLFVVTVVFLVSVGFNLKSKAFQQAVLIFRPPNAHTLRPPHHWWPQGQVMWGHASAFSTIFWQLGHGCKCFVAAYFSRVWSVISWRVASTRYLGIEREREGRRCNVNVASMHRKFTPRNISLPMRIRATSDVVVVPLQTLITCSCARKLLSEVLLKGTKVNTPTGGNRFYLTGGPAHAKPAERLERAVVVAPAVPADFVSAGPARDPPPR